MDTRVHLHKMHTALDNQGIAAYTLDTHEGAITVNDLLGKQVTLSFLGEIHCIACGRKTKKSFNQGYCFPCVRTLARCDTCIVKPELCHYDQGTCREPEWGLEHCFQPHYVYLANTGGIKVGITRGSNIPSRWIDQGAANALPVFRVSRRLIAGLVEVAFKSHVSDKTSWQSMLKAAAPPKDLPGARNSLAGSIGEELAQISQQYGEECLEYLPEAAEHPIAYPVLEYPQKVSSFNLDKQAAIEGSLLGIKGQYLIFDTGVINLRKFSGYHCQLSVT